MTAAARAMPKAEPITSHCAHCARSIATRLAGECMASRIRAHRLRLLSEFSLPET